MTDAIRTWIEDNRDEMVQPWLREAVLAVLDLCDEARIWGVGNPEVLSFEQDICRIIADALGVSDD
jgi:hypothetical protein